jgi:hypothetical protein
MRWPPGALTAVLAVGLYMPLPVLAVSVPVRIIDLAGKPVENAVVYAVPEAPMPLKKPPPAIIDQIHRQFAPQVNVVEVGTYVTFPNSDNILHSVYSFSPAKTFVLRLYAGRAAPPVRFDKPGIVVMGCQIHDNMIAWLLVVPTPYFGKTGADGVLVLRHLPAGAYRLHAWDVGMRKVTAARPFVVAAGARSPVITFQLEAGRMPRHGPSRPEESRAAGM